MGGKKTVSDTKQNTNYNNSNSFGYMKPEDTEDIKAFREWRPQVDPGLGYQYADARNELKSSFDDPLGGFSTPQMRDAQMRTGLRNLNQDEAQAFRQGNYDVNNQRSTQLGALSALTRPELVQTGSSGSGSMTGQNTTKESGGFLRDLAIGMASSATGGATGGKSRGA
jgi:hypothetical protein